MTYLIAAFVMTTLLCGILTWQYPDLLKPALWLVVTVAYW